MARRLGTVASLAAAAGVHVATVRRALQGAPIRGWIWQRLRPAAEAAGLEIRPTLVSRPPPPAGRVATGMSGHVRRQAWKPRKTAVGERPMSLGGQPLRRYERLQLLADEAELRAAGVSLAMPRTVAECPPPGSPCPHVRCRHHLAVEIMRAGRGDVVKLNFPDREIDELEETCSLRAARRFAERDIELTSSRGSHLRPVASCDEVGALLGLACERVRQIEATALTKLRVAAAGLAE